MRDMVNCKLQTLIIILILIICKNGSSKINIRSSFTSIPYLCKTIFSDYTIFYQKTLSQYVSIIYTHHNNYNIQIIIVILLASSWVIPI